MNRISHTLTPISSEQRAIATFPFLAPGARRDDFTQPFVIEQVGQHTLAFVVGEAYEEAVSQADVVVALGDPKDSEHIDVIIRPDDDCGNGV